MYYLNPLGLTAASSNRMDVLAAVGLTGVTRQQRSSVVLSPLKTCTVMVCKHTHTDIYTHLNGYCACGQVTFTS
jgi:hypothetical protein